MRQSGRDKRNYIIVGLCAVVAIMAVGFAAFSSQLTINSTSEVTSTWDVRITKIEKIIPSESSATDVSSECSDTGSPKQCNDGLTATISASLVSPGDSITYRIEVTNKGSLNAVLNRINLNDPSNSNVGFLINKDKNNQTIEDSGYRLLETNGVLNASGDSLDKGYVYLTIYYKEYEGQTSPTGDNKTVTATATFDFAQSSSEATPVSSLVIDQTFVPQYYGFSTTNLKLNSIPSESTVSEWTTEPSSLGRNYYLGYDINSSTNRVNAIYSCFIIENTQYCLKYGDGNTFYKNKTILNNLQTAGKITCSFISDSGAKCSYDESFGYLYLASEGDVAAGDSSSKSCYVESFEEYASCTE
ncbi:MAG: hypothetical protein IKJ43_01935 [Bacilli bacterium]|nr:hypothetical protein [Bacilli bacterium]